MSDSAEAAPQESPAGESAPPPPLSEEAPEGAGASESLRATRGSQARLWVYGIFCLGVSALLLVLYQSWAPIGTIRGEVLGGRAKRVVLMDVARDVYRKGTVREDGFEVSLPPFAKEPRVFVYGEGDSEHWAETEVLPVVEGVSQAPPIALWSSPLEITVREAEARFDWSAIPEGVGYPGRRRYSLLLRYHRAGEEMGEATLLCEAPKRSIALYELEQLFQEFDTSRRELEIELRAYDPGQQRGALWVGARRKWTLPASEAPAPLEKMPGSR